MSSGTHVPTTPASTSQSSKKRKLFAEESTTRQVREITTSQVRPKRDFSQGGDLVLKSVDGLEFHVHSVILSVASPVFADMFQIGSNIPGQVVDLAETGEMINLMLEFIYPSEPPTIASFDMLNKAMHVAKKYDLEGMQRHLCRELAMTGSPVSYANDPLGAFAFATAHDLKHESKLALDFARQSYHFNTVGDLVKISKSIPASVPWILLFGIPCIKKKILSDVLLKFHEEPMKLPRLSFVCVNCNVHPDGIRYSPPEWLARWAHGLIAELAELPKNDWPPFFQAAYLSEVMTRHGGALGACICVDRCTGPFRAQFLRWSGDVLRCLLGRMEGIGRLQKLIS